MCLHKQSNLSYDADDKNQDSFYTLITPINFTMDVTHFNCGASHWASHKTVDVVMFFIKLSEYVTKSNYSKQYISQASTDWFTIKHHSNSKPTKEGPQPNSENWSRTKSLVQDLVTITPCANFDFNYIQMSWLTVPMQGPTQLSWISSWLLQQISK